MKTFKTVLGFLFLFILLAGGLVFYHRDSVFPDHTKGSIAPSSRPSAGSASRPAASQDVSPASAAAEAADSLYETYYPYYGMLTRREKDAYGVLCRGLAQKQERIDVSSLKISYTSAQKIWKCVYYDHPELYHTSGECYFWYTSGGTCTCIDPSYYDISEEDEQYLKDISAYILEGAGKCSTDREKEEFIHDALAELTRYNAASPFGQSMISAFNGDGTVCAGYSRAFQYLMTACGIPCYYVSGYCDGDHAWNIVKLDDGYYIVDLTWDDCSSSKAYFNRCDTDMADHVKTDLSEDLPECSGSRYRNTQPMPGGYVILPGKVGRRTVG